VDDHNVVAMMDWRRDGWLQVGALRLTLKFDVLAVLDPFSLFHNSFTSTSFLSSQHHRKQHVVVELEFGCSSCSAGTQEIVGRDDDDDDDGHNYLLQ